MSSAPSAAAAQPTPRFTLMALAAIVLVAAGLRLAGLDRLPPGIHADQLGPSLAGLDVLRGQRPFTLTDYDIWLHAASFWALGVSPLAVRLLPALVGSLFPLSVYLALHGAYGRRVALLAAALGAVAIWPVALSRSGYSISYLPVGLGLCLWQLSAGWQTGRARHWVLAGGLLAAVQYVYYPARAVVLILMVAGVYLLLFGPRPRLWTAWPLLPVFLVAVLPLYWRTLQLDAEAARYGTVFILSPQNHAGSPLAALASQAWLALSMFFYHGDLNYRHNVPPHPVFDLFVLVPAGLGLVLLLKEWRRPRTLFWCLWLGGALGPMLLSNESPHFLRAAGSLPLVFVLPALGLDQLGQVVAQRGRRVWGAVVMAGVLLLSAGNTVLAYFAPPYRDNPALYYAFAGEDQTLAVAINQFLGVGWPGAGWLARSTTPISGRVVRLDRRLWSEADRERAVHLLVPLRAGATPAFQYVQTALSAGEAAAPAGTDMRLIVVPGQEQPAVSLLPLNRLISVSDGPLPSWAPPG
ncbi:MAG TPA: glycosyltransferase family 39 protein, partial [Chloroflexia bacterium]|nr:glycosyltransferase family 39 protein [Chloroflexia bacterium]